MFSIVIICSIHYTFIIQNTFGFATKFAINGLNILDFPMCQIDVSFVGTSTDEPVSNRTQTAGKQGAYFTAVLMRTVSDNPRFWAQEIV
jgi:hypothetical protein